MVVGRCCLSCPQRRRVVDKARVCGSEDVSSGIIYGLLKLTRMSDRHHEPVQTHRISQGTSASRAQSPETVLGCPELVGTILLLVPKSSRSSDNEVE